MKKSLLLLSLSVSLTGFSQQITELDSLKTIASQGYFGEYNPIAFNNAGTLFMAYIKSDSLFVDRHAAQEWGHTNGMGGHIDKGIKTFDMKHNAKTDELYILYTKADGIYFQTYNGSWSAPIYHAGTSSTQYFGCKLAVNEEDTIPYVLYDNNNQKEFYRIDLSAGDFVPISAPSNFNDYQAMISASDMQFNQDDGLLYVSYQRLPDPVRIEKFNGTSWSVFSAAIDNQYLFRSKISFRENQLIIGLNMNIANGSYTTAFYGMHLTNGTSATIEPVVNYGSDAATELYAQSVNPVNDYFAYSVLPPFTTSFFPKFKYKAGNTWYTINHGLSDCTISNLEYDPFGNLYFIARQSNRIRAFKIDQFTLSLGENELEDLVCFPNPTEGNISFTVDKSGNYVVTDMSGRKVLSGETEAGVNTVLMHSLQKGTYLLTLYSDSGFIQSTTICKQ